MKSILLFCSAILLLISCKKEEQTYYSVYIENRSTVAVEIIPYKSGIIHSDDRILLSPGAKFQFAEGFDRGINIGGGFDSKYLTGTDSIAVLFNSVKKTIHFMNNTSTSENSYYSYNSERNLGNWESYEMDVTDDSKFRRTIIYTYIFSELDYNFAQ